MSWALQHWSCRSGKPLVISEFENFHFAVDSFVFILCIDRIFRIKRSNAEYLLSINLIFLFFGLLILNDHNLIFAAVLGRGVEAQIEVIHFVKNNILEVAVRYYAAPAVDEQVDNPINSFLSLNLKGIEFSI